MKRVGKLVIFHPSPVLVETLDGLMRQLAPDVPYKNVLYPELLAEAMKTGITDKIRHTVRAFIDSVPEEPGTVILCACSTLGGCVEEMGALTRNRVIRIDRPMADRAIAIGSRIGREIGRAHV
jgi:hypothetical protein